MGGGCFRAESSDNRYQVPSRHAPPHRYYIVGGSIVAGKPQRASKPPELKQELFSTGPLTASEEANSIEVIRGACAAQAADDAECAICCDDLHKAGVSVLCDISNRRVCRHFYHTTCCQLIEVYPTRSCPLCRREFHHTVPVPSPSQDPQGWFQAVDANGSMDLGKTEVVDALSAVFPVDPEALTRNLETLWNRWDKTKSGSITFPEFVDPNQGLLHWVVGNQCRLGAGIPNIWHSPAAWFDYWDADGDRTLFKGEVIRALLRTFRRTDADVIRSVVATVWTDFDKGNRGTIDREEFLRESGFLNAILTNLALGLPLPKH